MKFPINGIIPIAALMYVLSQTAHAGRPLTVDDANMNDAGAGHIETWYARQAGGVNTWNVAPAYAPIKDIELTATLSRNQTEQLNISSIQGKWRITASNPEGCNLAMVLGISHLINGGGNTPYLNGIATCNHKLGAFHMNISISHPDSSKSLANWGVAYERDLGAATAHIEYFGQETAKPTVQIGLRRDIVPGLQIDGTVGRSDGDTVFSIGMKKSF